MSMKTISFVNMKGGVGKTTTAVNVADCLARDHDMKVAVLDVDPQFNATQCLLPAKDYVAHLKNGGDTILQVFDDEATHTASVVKGTQVEEPREFADIELLVSGDLEVLPGNIDLYRLEMRSGEGREFLLKRFIEERLGNDDFDYVIIDTPPTPSIWMTSALIASDYYLIPVKPEPLSITGIDLLGTIVDQRKKSYGLKLECLGVAFTMVDRPDSTMFTQAKFDLSGNKKWKDKMFEAYLPKRARFARNQLSQPFILVGEDYDLRQSLRKLVDEILGRL
jgi:chromosome partitioning protein